MRDQVKVAKKSVEISRKIKSAEDQTRDFKRIAFHGNAESILKYSEALRKDLEDVVSALKKFEREIKKS